MESRSLGKTGLRSSVIGFGCAPIASRAGTASSQRALELALNRGVTFFDTADFYGQGDSERLLGKTLSRYRRDDMIIATKAGMKYSERLKTFFFLKPLVRPLVRRFRPVRQVVTNAFNSQVTTGHFSEDHLSRAVEGSLKRLRTECVDFFLLHSPSMKDLQGGYVFEMLERLRRAGKIKYYGISSDVRTALEALKIGGEGFACLEVPINFYASEALSKLVPMASAQGVALIAREPFANGRIFSPSPVNFSFVNNCGLTIAQAAIRFLLSIAGISVVLPSMVNIRHIEENIQALSGLELPADARSKIFELMKENSKTSSYSDPRKDL